MKAKLKLSFENAAELLAVATALNGLDQSAPIGTEAPAAPKKSRAAKTPVADPQPVVTQAQPIVPEAQVYQMPQYDPNANLPQAPVQQYQQPYVDPSSTGQAPYQPTQANAPQQQYVDPNVQYQQPVQQGQPQYQQPAPVQQAPAGSVTLEMLRSIYGPKWQNPATKDRAVAILGQYGHTQLGKFYAAYPPEVHSQVYNQLMALQ